MVSTPDSHVHQALILPLSNVIRHADQGMVWSQPNMLPQGVIPPESVYQPDLQIDNGDPGRSYPQVDSPPVFVPQSGNCSGNGDNVPTQSQDEYLGTQTDVWVSVENINDYDYDDNHSQPSLGDGSTHCCDNGCEHGYYPDPMLSDPLHGALDNPPGHPLVSQENLPTEAGLHETMAKEQQLALPASQPTESQVVVAKELEIQAAQVTPANK